jgi:hypothetical protein
MDGNDMMVRACLYYDTCLIALPPSLHTPPQHIGFVVDLIVIVTSFCLELLMDTGSFLTIVRMWRVL